MREAGLATQKATVLKAAENPLNTRGNSLKRPPHPGPRTASWWSRRSWWAWRRREAEGSAPQASNRRVAHAVVGATGQVGTVMREILAERSFPIGELRLFATARSAGSAVEFGGHTVIIEDVATADPAGIDIALFSAGATGSRAHAPRFAAAGATVIDNSSAWRMDPEVPLVVPEVNPEAVADYKQKGIIANPNCSTIQMVVALKPLHDLGGLKRVIVSTYQAVSGSGKEAMDELSTRVSQLFNGLETEPSVYPHTIAFNCLPHIDVFKDDGYTKEEHKMIFETRKILEIPELGVCPTCVRVPVFNGHAESITAEFEKELTVSILNDYLTNIFNVKEVQNLGYFLDLLDKRRSD